MLTVEDYGRIRRAHRGGMSIGAIARVFIVAVRAPKAAAKTFLLRLKIRSTLGTA